MLPSNALSSGQFFSGSQKSRDCSMAWWRWQLRRWDAGQRQHVKTSQSWDSSGQSCAWVCPRKYNFFWWEEPSCSFATCLACISVGHFGLFDSSHSAVSNCQPDLAALQGKVWIWIWLLLVRSSNMTVVGKTVVGKTSSSKHKSEPQKGVKIKHWNAIPFFLPCQVKVSRF